MRMSLTLNQDILQRFEELKAHCYSTSTLDDSDPHDEVNHSSFMSILLDCYENSYLRVDRFSGTYTCPKCDHVTFPHVDEFLNHYCTNHSCDMTKCPCGILLNDPASFIKHFTACVSIKTPVAHTITDNDRSCLRCNQLFKSQPLLDQHIHSVHYPAKYECNWCGKWFRWQPVFNHHREQCQFRPSIITEEQANEVARNFLAVANLFTMNLPSDQFFNSIISSSKSSLTCLCSLIFNDGEKYREHFFTCPTVAGHLTKFNESTKVTTTTVNRQESEEIIHDLSMNSRRELSRRMPNDHYIVGHHQAVKMKSSKKFFCRLCDKEFTSKLSIKQHIDGKHTSQGKYVCNSCGKRYRWGASFYYHRRTCSTNSGDSNNGTTTSIISQKCLSPNPNPLLQYALT